jgi:1-acyl-sn-glycerol-3-phosphate acyltransferase
MNSLAIDHPRSAVSHYFFWLFYFLISIGVMGSTVGYGLIVPLLLLGRINRRVWKLAGEVMVFGVDLLLKGQPWLKADVRISLPPQCITISNHRSHLDMFFLLARISKLRVVVKSTLFRIPLLSSMMRLMKMIPVESGNVESYWQAMEEARRAAEAHDCVHIFPEMKRCSEGFQGVQSFHLAPFKIMKDLNLPVVPIVFKDTDRVWPKRNLGLSFRFPISVFSVPPLIPKDYACAEALRTAAWEKISDGLK